VNRARALLFAVTLAAAAASAHAATTVTGAVIGNGATPSAGATGGTKVLRGTAGQTAVGLSANAVKDLCSGFWCFGGVRVLSVDGGLPGQSSPAALAFGLPQPNPMTDRVTLSLALPKTAQVRVLVFDVSGRTVGAMHAGRLDPGTYRLEWDGTDGEGHAAGAGVYFARLEVDGRAVAGRRLVRVR
jgi:hypothetical protein